MLWPMNLEFAAEADDNNNNIDTTPAYVSRTVIETETVEVAYLLRRPLVRMRYLAKVAKVDCSAATERVCHTTEPSTVRDCEQKLCDNSHAKTTTTSSRRCFAFHHNMVERCNICF